MGGDNFLIKFWSYAEVVHLDHLCTVENSIGRISNILMGYEFIIHCQVIAKLFVAPLSNYLRQSGLLWWASLAVCRGLSSGVASVCSVDSLAALATVFVRDVEVKWLSYTDEHHSWLYA
ncbi:hypothetical protein DAPPUDRAFT_105383 [Daphnia pulex]|uniref:Uncharacterized protein n=1 Tax=Daphnia pulex TaxID=6669 RepID=E9GQL3_DAPPU|nr:hypothetical protein DAPPUDRAFT_105383 [Daphnia pulex]|eukprot:EFX78307.1 hypothetical protein DAPPUDRAFT_105383 [Daphnia pulex]